MSIKLCEECQANPANIHLTQIVHNEVTVQHLCEECARKKGISIVIEEEKSLPHITAGSQNNQSRNVKKEEMKITCAKCHMSLAEFKQKGWLGCPSCYLAFNQEIDTLLIEVHGTSQHTGKDYKISKKLFHTIDDLTFLRDELSNAIRCEKFELAAVIRDKIKSFNRTKSTDKV